MKMLFTLSGRPRAAALRELAVTRLSVTVPTMLAIALLLGACSDSGGSSPPAPPPTAPAAPVISGFLAAPTAINAGQSATLTWTVAFATSISIAPGIGVVTGSSVVVSPAATTNYTLTASNGSASSTATATVTVSPLANFTVVDQPVGQAGVSYLQIEISPDMQFMTWIEENMGAGGASIAWLCALDPNTGDLRPFDGRGVRVADIDSNGSPQWGVDDGGVFSVTVDVAGRFVIARPNLTAGGEATALVSFLPTPADPSRSYPYPTRMNAAGLIAYIQDDPVISGALQLWYIDRNDPLTQVQITQGPNASIGQFNLPPFLVDIQRWFYDARTGRDGLPIVIYGDANPADPVPAVTVEQFDFTQSPALASRIADATPTLFDPFPFLFNSERFVFAGINASNTAGVFARDATGQYTVQLNSITPDASFLANPSNLASAEPFVRNGRAYTAFQINEPGAPGSTNGEIWLASVFDASLLRRISLSSPSRRADPEFFFGTQKVWVYYYAREQNFGPWTLRRAETGL